MSNLLEITGDDINQLTDADFRTLIGLLCEADYRATGLSTAGITWGGNQDAPDGGLDVIVRGQIPLTENSFIPRGITGFQVKKPDMPKAAIVKEMCPKGLLREEIRTLISEKGAYIIVSSSGSTAHIALQNRISAMKEAVKNEPNHKNLYVDFFDRNRVASWVRLHPSLVLWVRTKIGRQLKGWRPYENWSKTPAGIEDEFLLDDGLRLHDGTASSGTELAIKSGLLKLRALLETPRSSVRLTGLSGVGKTRLVQALFDQRVGEQSLNPALAIYADMSDSPDPDPRSLAEQLIATKNKAILIVDNCPPGLHRRLTDVCSGTDSTISLITVEYDVRDDLPNETKVFTLEPASEEIIEKLIQKRFPYIGQIDARRIGNLSGGNARVAISLANTVQKGETLSGFKDDELFERLFWQRYNQNDSLLLSAEACSLVYSFEGTDTSSDTSELNFLAALIGKSGADVYRDVTVLKDRDLVQSRDVWRAILPHAIANKLAKRALSSIPKDVLVEAFLHTSERMLKSFTRRLNYLHDSDIANQIVTEWLAKDGWLGKVDCNFNDLGLAVFRNIAPVSPEKVLEAMERTANGQKGNWFTSRENTHLYEFVRLLRHLAYDPALFERSVELICRFALKEQPEEKSNSTRNVLKSLFYLYLSGTHAPLEMRAKFIAELLESKIPEHQELGIALLDAALETGHFSSSHEFGFGARPRDYGYMPRTPTEQVNWYETYINLCTHLAISSAAIAPRARAILASHFRGLWSKAGMFDALEKAARKIQDYVPWNNGWGAVQSIMRYDAKRLDEENYKRLQKLEGFLKPDNLLERARTFALSDRNLRFDLDDNFDESESVGSVWQRMEQTTHQIGAEVSKSPEILAMLLPEIVSIDNSRLHSFGKGLCEGASDKQTIWNDLYSQLEKTPPDRRQINVLLGFIAVCSKNDPKFCQYLLDGLVSDKLLGSWFPIFQTTAGIDQRGLTRLHQALDSNTAHMHTFLYIAYKDTQAVINDDEFAKITRKIFTKQNGQCIALEILSMRFHDHNQSSPLPSIILLTLTREIIAKYNFSNESKRHINVDYELSILIEQCLIGPESADAGTQICKNFATAIDTHQVYAFNYPKMLTSLAKLQPVCFMDVFLGENIKPYQRRRIFSDDFERSDNPLNAVPEEAIIAWCELDADRRYPIMAEAIQSYDVSDQGTLTWKPLIFSLFKKAPNLNAILEPMAEAMIPSGWSGSLADILQKKSVLYELLYEHDNPAVVAWAEEKNSKLKEVIRQERAREDRENREQHESFE